MARGRWLTTTDIVTICACYGLGTPRSHAQVHQGTSAVYRVVCEAPRRAHTIAVKAQEYDRRLWAAKCLEARLLASLRPAFSRVPVLLQPSRADHGMQLQPWGLRWEGTAISAYRWVDTRPYRGSERQRRSAAQSLGELQQQFQRLSSSAGGPRPAALASLLDAPTAEILPDFASSERTRSEADPAAGLPYRSLVFLQEQHELLRAELDRHADEIRGCPRGLLHSDFTPTNCGYGDDDEVRIVFDIEAVRFGPLWLVGALAIATFALDRGAEPATTARAMEEMAAELRSVCPGVCPRPGLLLPLMRLVYVDATWRQLEQRRINARRGWGFLREDVRNLAWLHEWSHLLAHL